MSLGVQYELFSYAVHDGIISTDDIFHSVGINNT